VVSFALYLSNVQGSILNLLVTRLGEKALLARGTAR
jgi:hypothetical protein